MNYFQRYLVEEFAEDYQEGLIPRREALRLIGSVTGSLALATSILAACTPAEVEDTARVPITGTGIQPPAPGASAQAPAPAATTQPPGASTTAPASPQAPAAGSPGTQSSSSTAPSSASSAYGTVSPDDPAVQAGPVEFPSGNETLMAYQAIPSGSGPWPVVLVCHENRGLNAHIEDVARRLAKAGYLALAVDLLSRQGGSAQVGSGGAPGALSNMDPEQFVADFKSAVDYLNGLPEADTSRLGMVGFCFGGGVTWLVATRMPELKAAVPFYGPPPPVEEVASIEAAVLAVYGGRDQRITGTAATMEKAMQENGKIFEKVIYEDADHAFFNDTGPRYHPEAARDAWARLLDWFARYV